MKMMITISWRNRLKIAKHFQSSCVVVFTTNGNKIMVYLMGNISLLLLLLSCVSSQLLLAEKSIMCRDLPTGRCYRRHKQQTHRSAKQSVCIKHYFCCNVFTYLSRNAFNAGRERERRRRSIVDNIKQVRTSFCIRMHRPQNNNRVGVEWTEDL